MQFFTPINIYLSWRPCFRSWVVSRQGKCGLNGSHLTMTLISWDNTPYHSPAPAKWENRCHYLYRECVLFSSSSVKRGWDLLCPLSSPPRSHYPLFLYARLCRVLQSVLYVKEFSHGGLRIQQIDTIKGKHFFCFLNDPHLSAGAPPVHPHPASVSIIMIL